MHDICIVFCMEKNTFFEASNKLHRKIKMRWTYQTHHSKKKDSQEYSNINSNNKMNFI